ncbi:transmembrane amino acid transporter protein [Ancylostoma caninum]|uniref:Transmembrane amino acid transporter protein n=2 Tax=Ancylostoma caninum TaxID=29170 RepID=A0A368G1V7_ANCCA|nr:transmembrane amino acid transporter protein [Ancylostoma caninum]
MAFSPPTGVDKDDLLGTIPENWDDEIQTRKRAESAVRRADYKKKISTTFSLVNMIRGMIGPGCFAMPMSFKQAGLWGAMCLDFLLGALSTVCMIKLVISAQYLVKLNKCAPLDYGNMAGAAFASSDFKFLRKLEHVARWFVNCCLIFLQFGIASIYYIFVLDHLKEIVDVIWPENGISRDTYFLIVLPAFIALSMVRNIHAMSWICLFGNVLMTISLVIILYKVIVAPHIHTSQLPAFTNVKGTVMAAGAILYALEGQALVLPLENKMRHPKEMAGWTGVLTTGISLVTLIYAACGFYGFITYGESVAASITLNLSNAPLDFSVKIMLMLVVYSSYLLQEFPVVQMLFPFIKIPLRARKVRRAYIVSLEFLFRLVFVLITLGISWAIPNLDDIIPLFGGSAGMTLSLVIPPTLETVTFFREWWHERPRHYALIHIGLNICYFTLGWFFVITGTQANVAKILSR